MEELVEMGLVPALPPAVVVVVAQAQAVMVVMEQHLLPVQPVQPGRLQLRVLQALLAVAHRMMAMVILAVSLVQEEAEPEMQIMAPLLKAVMAAMDR
jgi:hypothetical protein